MHCHTKLDTSANTCVWVGGCGRSVVEGFHLTQTEKAEM